MNWIKLTEDDRPPLDKWVLLLIENEAIQGKRERVRYCNYQTGVWEWREEYDVISLSSHGCGCCSAPNPLPTHWCELPTLPSEETSEKTSEKRE